ncbi:MAG: hypothetical protein J6S85_26500 [Methanobrevibacter sp.]|nr:hypothetical protein [Methanobrevibacter sp.]MBO7717145.1 hypothetical protein [Methanobrevibacter sp.]
MNDLRCSMCGKPLTNEEIDKQEVVLIATAIGKRMILCDRDYNRVLSMFDKEEHNARLQNKRDT